MNMELPLYLSNHGMQNMCEPQIVYRLHMAGIITQIKQGARINQETSLTSVTNWFDRLGLL
jgi:hypothetical protein